MYLNVFISSFQKYKPSQAGVGTC